MWRWKRWSIPSPPLLLLVFVRLWLTKALPTPPTVRLTRLWGLSISCSYPLYNAALHDPSIRVGQLARPTSPPDQHPCQSPARFPRKRPNHSSVSLVGVPLDPYPAIRIFSAQHSISIWRRFFLSLPTITDIIILFDSICFLLFVWGFFFLSKFGWKVRVGRKVSVFYGKRIVYYNWSDASFFFIYFSFYLYSPMLFDQLHTPTPTHALAYTVDQMKNGSRMKSG